MSKESLQDWLSWLETLSPREIVLGLDRVQVMLERMALSRPPLVVQIAGTNGKGSCAAFLESLLHAAGETTGCYTSPHLVRYNERIRVDRKPCSDEEIVAAFTRVESQRQELPLTYFEFGTLAALHVFSERGVSASILEVGMGGRLDAVNAVDADGGIITNVALDHCAWLGEDVETIATEKAGIMRAGKPLVFGSLELPVTITEHAQKTAADLWLAGQDFEVVRHGAADWDYRGRDVELKGLRRPCSGGDIQLENAAASLALLEATGKSEWLDVELVNAAIAALELPGRLEIVNARHRWVLDVAHNAAAAKVLAGSLKDVKGSGSATAIVSVLGDRDVGGFVAPLCASIDRWIAVGLDGPRGRPAHEIARDIANSCGKSCAISDSLGAAMQIAENMSAADDTILITGSFYLVGPALDELYSRRTGE